MNRENLKDYSLSTNMSYDYHSAISLFNTKLNLQRQRLHQIIRCILFFNEQIKIQKQTPLIPKALGSHLYLNINLRVIIQLQCHIQNPKLLPFIALSQKRIHDSDGLNLLHGDIQYITDKLFTDCFMAKQLLHHKVFNCGYYLYFSSFALLQEKIRCWFIILQILYSPAHFFDLRSRNFQEL